MADQPSFQDKMQMDAKELWADHKIFFIIFGVLLIVVKFRDLIIDILVSSAKRTVDSAKKEDSQLAKQEGDASKAADDLVAKANSEAGKEQPISDDWNKK